MDLNEITYKINGAIFEVNRELGAVFLEKVYESVLMIELAEAGLNAENQAILELKASESIQKIHEAQLLNYLKATKFKMGLLVNFTYPKAEIKRFILSN